jgi:hypothetical protein
MVVFNELDKLMNGCVVECGVGCKMERGKWLDFLVRLDVLGWCTTSILPICGGHKTRPPLELFGSLSPVAHGCGILALGRFLNIPSFSVDMLSCIYV